MYSQLGYDTEIRNLRNAIEEYKNEKFFLWWAPYHTHLPYNPGHPYDEMFMPKGYKISESTRKRLEIIKTKMILHKPGLLSQFEEDLAKGITRRSNHPITAAALTIEEEDKPVIMSLYDGELRAQDEEIESYIKTLDELHLLDETIIVITSDHGEEIGERGSIGHASCSLAGTLYDEVIRVPLIIRYPKALPKGKVIDTQVSLIDIMPTMFEIIGLDIPKETEGLSFMPLIRGESDFREEAYSETRPCGFQLRDGDERKIYAIRTPDWKFIYNYDPDNNNCKYELYDLKNDSGEKRNLFNEKTDIANQFKEKLDKWIKKPSFLLNRNNRSKNVKGKLC